MRVILDLRTIPDLSHRCFRDALLIAQDGVFDPSDRRWWSNREEQEIITFHLVYHPACAVIFDINNLLLSSLFAATSLLNNQDRPAERAGPNVYVCWGSAEMRNHEMCVVCSNIYIIPLCSFSCPRFLIQEVYVRGTREGGMRCVYKLDGGNAKVCLEPCTTISDWPKSGE